MVGWVRAAARLARPGRRADHAAALVGRLLVPVDRAVRLRPDDRARQLAGVLPALPADGVGGREGAAVLVRAVPACSSRTSLFLPALMVLYRLTRERFGDARRAPHDHLPRHLAAVVRVLDGLHREPRAAADLRHVPAARATPRSGRACAVGALATLARPVGIMLAPAIAWQVFEDLGRRLSWRLLWQLLPVLLLPLALIALPGLPVVAHRRGLRDALGRGARLEPRRRPALHPADPGRRRRTRCGSRSSTTTTSAWPPARSRSCAYFWLMVALIRTRKAPMTYRIFALGCVVLAAYTGTWLGFPRFGLVIFPLFWMLALWGENERFDSVDQDALPRADGRLRVRLLRCGNLHAVSSEVETLRRHLERRAAAARARADAGHDRRLRRRRLAPARRRRPAAPARRVLRAARRPRLRRRRRAGRGGPRRRLLRVRLGLHDRRRRDRAALGEAGPRRREWEPAGGGARRRPACRSSRTSRATPRADGGDLLFLDARTLVAGRGYRTNAAAHRQLAALLAPRGVDRRARRPAARPRARRTCCTRCRSSRRSPTTWRSCSSG